MLAHPNSVNRACHCSATGHFLQAVVNGEYHSDWLLLLTKKAIVLKSINLWRVPWCHYLSWLNLPRAHCHKFVLFHRSFKPSNVPSVPLRQRGFIFYSRIFDSARSFAALIYRAFEFCSATLTNIPAFAPNLEHTYSTRKGKETVSQEG